MSSDKPPALSSIDALHFYGRKDKWLTSTTASHPSHLPYIAALQQIQQRHLQPEEKELFQVFTKQDLAFQAFDNLDRPLQARSKIFTYEALEAGKRHFLLAENDVFMERYFQIPLQNRHVYEIIRYTFPCRLYFDLEFNQRVNPSADGNELTRRWVELVIWKLHELYEVDCRPEDIVVLDSSTDEKFSKHLVFHLYQRASDTSLLVSSTRSALLEYLFADNYELSLVTRAILLDMTSPAQATAVSNETDSESSSCPIVSKDSESVHGGDGYLCVVDGTPRVPRTEFRDFWLETPTDNTPSSGAQKRSRQFFVDTGVYTKNRAFRLYGSCKHGKQKMLGISAHDEARYYRFSAPPSLSAASFAAAKRKDITLKSFVIPIDVLVSHGLPGRQMVPSPVKDGEATTAQAASQVYAAFDAFEDMFNHTNYARLPRLHDLISIRDDSQVGRKRAFDVMEAVPTDAAVNRRLLRCALLPTHHLSIQDSSVLRSFFMQSTTSSSSFVGAPQQSGAAWKQNVVAQSRAAREPTPFPAVDRFVTWFYAQTRGTVSQGYIGSWVVYKYLNKGGFPVVKIRYQIQGNRFCESIQRQHRSNGIYVECNLMSRCARQRCWDVDCQYFAFTEIPLPEGCIPMLPEEVLAVLDKSS